MILVTGGTGYIGSHTCVALSKTGHELLILDNLSNSRAEVIDRLEKLCGSRPQHILGDIRDAGLLAKIFSNHKIDAVIHFAALKSVGESVEKPLEYYDNNVHGTLQLLAAMRSADVKSLVFSSSAAVYGNPVTLPIFEEFACSPTNPYGRSKLIIEDVLKDLARADPDWHIACLRYFNPIGAHESGEIGEDPQGTPNNLIPILAEVAAGERDFLHVLGDDYPTRDGTGVRDYIHVVDLAEGHIAALNYLERNSGLLTANLGTGQGYSVLEVIRMFERVSGHSIPYKISPRRAGDVAECWADVGFARKTLDWEFQRGLEQMCADAWRWRTRHLNGLAL